jgi:superfamily II helicase
MSELLITDKVQVAEKGNAKCNKCRKKILEGEPRLQVYHTTRYGYQPTYICYRCSKMRLAEEEEALKIAMKLNKTQKKNLIDAFKKCSKVLIANTLMEDLQDKN